MQMLKNKIGYRGLWMGMGISNFYQGITDLYLFKPTTSKGWW